MGLRSDQGMQIDATAGRFTGIYLRRSGNRKKGAWNSIFGCRPSGCAHETAMPNRPWLKLCLVRFRSNDKDSENGRTSDP